MKPAKKNLAAVNLGRLGGSKNSPAQQFARRENAKRGGRPRRVCNCCGELVRGGHLDNRQDSRCKQPGWHWESPQERRARRGIAE